MNSATSKILSILLLICVTASLLSIAFHMFNGKYKTETALYSQEDDSVSFKAVYVRDEEVINYNGDGVVCYEIPDGGKLGKGSIIANIYSDESQIDIKQQISDLENKLEIVSKIQNPGTIEAAQPANLSTLINEKYVSIINSREKGNIENISGGTDELIVLLSTYQLVTDDTINFNQRENDIKAQIAQLKSEETVPLDSIVSDRSAYFVSYADGYEDTFSIDNIGSITPETIDKVKDDGITDDKTIMGKLISGYEWYVVGIIDNRAFNFSINEEVKLKFQSTSEIIDGEICDIRSAQKAGQSIVVVKCDEVTYELVQHRTERVEMIKGQYEGIKVSRKAIHFKNVEEVVTDEETGEKSTKTENCKGVYVKLGEQINFKKLDIVYEGDNFVLSSLNAGNDYVSLYDDIVVEGVDADGN